MLSALSGYTGNEYMTVYAARRTVRTIPAARPDSPVAPVEPVKPPKAPDLVMDDTPLNKEELLRQLETDPAAIAVRSRIQYVGAEEEYNGVIPKLPGTADEDTSRPNLPKMNRLDLDPTKIAGLSTPEKAAGSELSGLPGAEKDVGPGDRTDAAHTKSAAEIAEEGKCQTCEERKYQDGSDDPGVSFKTPTNIAPEQAAAAVRGHENEHVVREQAEAQREGRKVVSQSVTYHTAICPECGKVYVSGGETRTTTAAVPETEPAEPLKHFFAVA